MSYFAMRRIHVLLLVLLIWALAGTIASATLAYRLTSLERSYAALSSELEKISGELSEAEQKYRELSASVVVVDIAIDYGNGTVVWYNDTIVSKGASLLAATALVARVDYVYGAWGAYVTSINGVEEVIVEPGAEGYSWMWYRWNEGEGKWELGPVAADAYQLSNFEKVMWRYEHWKF